MNDSQKKLLSELVDKGAAIGGRNIPTIHLAVAEDLPSGLFFCSVFPEDQHHAHLLEYDSAKEEAAGISFRRDGRLVAYVAPLDEWHDLDLDTEIAQRARWREWLESEKNRSDFETFLDSCKEDLSP